MSAPSLGERMHIARLATQSSLAPAVSRLALLPLFGQRLVRPRAEALLFIPSDLRPADPSLVDEMSAGQMGLAGIVLDLGGGSPFGVAAPDRAWARELHGFAWLGSLRAEGTRDAVEIARRLIADWCRRHRGRVGAHGIPAEPLVAARRVTSWIVSAGFLLEDADPVFYRIFTRALGAELGALDRACRRAPPGYPRLASLMALTLACLATEGHDRDLPRVEAQLLKELAGQFFADGGHISRNAEAVVDVALDLLPIRQCYAARGRTVPGLLAQTIERMLDHLRAMTLTSGRLGRFNGVGSVHVEALATVLSTATAPDRKASQAPGTSGYARLEMGRTTVLVDCGPPPPLALSATAHAGALSFEMAHQGESIIVNRGAPGPAQRGASTEARATASHSTLVLDGQSSARLMRSRRLERLIGGPGLVGPDRVTAGLDESDAEALLVAAHDGYLARFGLIHERRLGLRHDGQALEGADILRPPRGTLRLARDLPFSVHFHFPIEARIRPAPGDGIVIEPAGGPPWRLSANGARMMIESATDFAPSRGTSPARQAVIRAATPGETIITWRLERV